MKRTVRARAWKWLVCATVGVVLGANLCHAEDPRRVVSLAPSLTELVFALGAGERLVGVTAQCDEPPEARALDRVGTFLTPNVELVVAKQPDLILAMPSPGNRRAVEALQRMGLRVVVLEPPGAFFRRADRAGSLRGAKNARAPSSLSGGAKSVDRGRRCRFAGRAHRPCGRSEHRCSCGKWMAAR